MPRLTAKESATYRKERGISAVFASCIFLFFSAVSLEAQYFKPFTALKVIKTDHFDIIYPEESARTAETLAGFADAMYDRVTGLLNIRYPARIPVTITPHTDQFNGLTTSLPYVSIILFDTVMEPEWTSFANNLESLFLHELTHAISLSSRGGFFNVLHSIFGGWVYPAALNAPLFMVEGAAVSFESLDGSGRANDPLVRETLIQAVHENKFLTPFQSSGIYDLPPSGRTYYYYGGLFSAWLQEKYGMEKYARLWEAMGRDWRFSFRFYKAGVYYLFENIYGRPFLDAWDEFKESFRLETIEENSNGIVYNGPFYRKRILINGLASGGGKIFFIDETARRVLSYDPETGKTRTVLAAGTGAYHLEASGDGKALLLSSYSRDGSLARASVAEYSARSGWGTGRAWPGLYGGRYFRDGVLGISSDLHSGNIVYRRKPGRRGREEEEVLLRGSAELVYINPVAVDDTWIAFIAARQGRRELCVYNYDAKAAFTLRSELPDDGERWKYIRSLGVSEGRLFFAFNHDRGMYKLGSVTLTPDGIPEAVFSERDFSGGVFLPAMAGGELYYRGAFAVWDALMRFGEAPDSMRGVRADLSLVPWNEAEYPATTDTAGAFAGGVGGGNPAAELPLTRKNYHALSYLNPLKFWLPFPLIRVNEAALEDKNAGFADMLSLDGGGILSYMADPAQMNQIIMTAAFDARSLMGIFDVQWTNNYFGLPLTFAFKDDVRRPDNAGTAALRRTDFGFSALLNHGIGSGPAGFSLFPGFGISLRAPEREAGSSPYTWEYDDPHYVFSLGLNLSSLTRFSWEIFGSGLDLTAYGHYAMPDETHLTYRFEGVFQAAFEPFLPLRFRLYGIRDENGMNLAGFSSLYAGSAADDLAPAEYNSIAYSLKWLAGGEAEVKLFSLEIQRNLSHVYFNRIFSTLAYRGGFYDYKDVAGPAAGERLWDDYRLTQSLVLRLGLTFSAVIIPALPAKFTLYAKGMLKISNLSDGDPANDYAIGIYFDGISF
ncbi:MAG: hypothetical protein LBI91_01255 [Spirochaetaceae bacterium]|jgi:hypothetical protein|nr:hypothetical protein [Spirochaetaceae bacterium]